MDTGTVIVALPSLDDKVHQISSEEVPHLTLLYLGDQSESDKLVNIVEFVKHAASQLSPFGLQVDHRGMLGSDEADVVFFDKTSWDFPRIKSFRTHLLQEDSIQRAYLSAEQFPEWTPHLTLGYPQKPARPDDREYPGIRNVVFDRIAVWTGDFDGPEFRLKYDDHGGMEVAMSGMTAAMSHGEGAVDELFHYGKKGMKWGVTTVDRAGGSSSKVPTKVAITQKKPGTYAKTKGGANHPIHNDAKPALVARQKAKKSTTDSLSNADLQTAIRRMQLEQQFKQLDYSVDRRSAGKRFVQGFLGLGRPKKPVDFYEKGGELTKENLGPVVKSQVAKRLPKTN